MSGTIDPSLVSFTEERWIGIDISERSLETFRQLTEAMNNMASAFSEAAEAITALMPLLAQLETIIKSTDDDGDD